MDAVIPSLPAGHIEEGEDPIETAKRELAEETGYTADNWEDLGYSYDFPTKDLHKAFIVKATNARKTSETHHESTEDISLRILPVSEVKKEIRGGKWRTNSVIAALVLAGIFE